MIFSASELLSSVVMDPNASGIFVALHNLQPESGRFMPFNSKQFTQVQSDVTCTYGQGISENIAQHGKNALISWQWV
jgi:hypothetical protein